MRAQASTAGAQPDAMMQAKRPARVLLGWLSPQEAALMQGGREVQAGRGSEDTPEHHLARARRAREVVGSRSAGVDQANIVQKPPGALVDYMGELQKQALIGQLLSEGWQPALVDISRVCATQPYIYTDHAVDRSAGVSADDVVALAKVTLPGSGSASLRATFDSRKQAFVFSSPNPNLRVVDRFEQPIEPGAAGYGFVVRIIPSFLLVAAVKGRYILRDGYHRAYGLLRRGVNVVPALVRNFETVEELSIPGGMLPRHEFLGDRPPRLCDYLDDTVAADVELPATEKMVIVQGLELALAR
jgi:hypothetical protein